MFFRVFLLFIILNTSAWANPYDYKVTRVIDGDTVEIEAPFLPEELKKTLRLRIHGIDTPEKGHLAHCSRESLTSNDVRLFVQQQINQAKEIKIILKKWDKYGGRVLGDVLIDGVALSETLIQKGYAALYYGKGKKKDWCK